MHLIHLPSSRFSVATTAAVCFSALVLIPHASSEEGGRLDDSLYWTVPHAEQMLEVSDFSLKHKLIPGATGKTASCVGLGALANPGTGTPRYAYFGCIEVEQPPTSHYHFLAFATRPQGFISVTKYVSVPGVRNPY